MASSGRRVSYDKVWGALLLLTCILPADKNGQGYLWELVPEGGPWVRVWLLAGALTGVVATTIGLLGWRSRWRHFLNFALGVATLGLPLAAPVIWQRFPATNPATLPLQEMAAIGWVVAAALAAIYAGAGIRIVRPSHVTGQTLGALGALLLAVFAFLPLEGHASSYAWARVVDFWEDRTRWRQFVPFLLVALAALVATCNLVRSRAEVLWAKATRILLVGGLLFGLVTPLLDAGLAAQHAPRAWGMLRFLAPLFLSLDGCIAFVAISITRSGD